jgi:hypothetical protein
MANEEIVNEFDALFADIIATTPELAVAEVEDPGEPGVVAPPVLKMEAVAVVPTQSVVAQPAPKPDRYREVDGKVKVEGGPCETTVYPRGYVKFQLSQDWNKFTAYLEDVIALRDFFRDEARYSEWEARAVAAGLKSYRRG